MRKTAVVLCHGLVKVERAFFDLFSLKADHLKAVENGGAYLLRACLGFPLVRLCVLLFCSRRNVVLHLLIDGCDLFSRIRAVVVGELEKILLEEQALFCRLTNGYFVKKEFLLYLVMFFIKLQKIVYYSQ